MTLTTRSTRNLRINPGDRQSLGLTYTPKGIAVCCECGPCLGEATESCHQDVRRRVVG